LASKALLPPSWLVFIWAGHGSRPQSGVWDLLWQSLPYSVAEELFGGDFQNNDKDAKTVFHPALHMAGCGYYRGLLTWARSMHVEQLTYTHDSYTSNTRHRGQTSVPGAWWGAAQAQPPRDVPRAPTSDARHLTVASRLTYVRPCLPRGPRNTATRPRGGFPIYSRLCVCVCSLFRSRQQRRRVADEVTPFELRVL
jgi:hypothetical protein